MTVDEAKKILLAANLSPLERNALYILLSKVDCEDLPGEIWRDVVGYEGKYQVSNFGRVKSFCRGRVNLMKLDVDNRGYLRVGLYKDGKQRNQLIHILVATAFIPNPENKPEVNHENGVKIDNRVENLAWVTSSENKQHAWKMGLIKAKRGCEHGRAKLTAEQVREIRRDCIPRNPQFSFQAFAKKFNVSAEVIKKAHYRRSYKDVE